MLLYAEPLPTLSGIARALLTRRRVRPADVCNDGAFFGWARDALTVAVSALSESGTEIWLPAYICDDVVGVLRSRFGGGVRFYDVREDLSPDWETVSIGEWQPAVFVLVHYFGFLNDVATIKDWRGSRPSVKVIEDSAHRWPFAVEEPLVVGDAAVYSWRKFLPVPDGALLVGPGFAKEAGSAVGARFPWAWLARAQVKRLLRVTPSSVYGRRSLSETGDTDETAETTPERDIHELSLSILADLQPKLPRIVERRRENYRLLSTLAERCGVKPVFDLADEPDACPHVFAFRAKDRDTVIGDFRRAGIAAQLWPFLPAEIKGNSTYPMANLAAREIIVLPVHQGLSGRDMERIGSVLGRALRATG